jgi:hypothetical protein
VTLQGAVNHRTQITFELRNPGTTTIIASASNDEDLELPGTQITTDGDGSYNLNGVPPATYDITAKSSKWLRHKQTNVSVSRGRTTIVDFLGLKGGDADNSNSVNVFDLSILKHSYGKSKDQPGYDQRADFDRPISCGDVS